MNKISIYVSNANLTPSSYYRLTQYFCGIGARMHSSLPDSVYNWWHKKGGKSKHLFKPFLYFFYVVRTLAFLVNDVFTLRSDLVIISRVIVPHHMPLLHKQLIKQLAINNMLVWDFDDNILANKSISPSDFRFFSKYSHTIVVTSDFLKSLVDKNFQDKVVILPTTDGDLQNLNPSLFVADRRRLYDKEIRLVWVGTYTGLDYLKPLIPALEEAAQTLCQDYGKTLSLHIVCNKPLTTDCSSLQLVNIAWEREIAKQEIVHAHIGIMPLPDTEFTRGKGGFKLIQYMAASLPVIASNVGFNQQVVGKGVGYLINDGQSTIGWKDAVLELSTCWENYLLMARCAKEHYDTHFSFEKNKSFWEKLASSQQN